MRTQFKVGDRVVRTSREWRGVKVGDINVVSEVHGNNLSLEGQGDKIFDGDFFKLAEPLIVISLPAVRPFAVGDRVRMIAESPAHGMGEIDVGDIGVIVRTGEEECDYCEFVIDFPNQRGWNADASDLEHEHPQFVTDESLPEISLDEAVTNCQNLRQQIAGLEVKAKQYEQVMRKHGLKFI